MPKKAAKAAKKSAKPAAAPSSLVDQQLARYRSMRDFAMTAEPSGESGARAEKKADEGLPFVIQKHAATRLHYDFRLGWRGVLKSWAVTKGPSYVVADKRLAVEVEVHPIEYGGFEGTIPKGQYGGGTVMVWDHGTWAPESVSENVDAALEKGDLKFTLHGKKLKGSWVLVRTRGFGSSKPGKSWLLIKHRDQYASTDDLTMEKPRSAISNKLLAEIAQEGGGDVAKAATGDPAPKTSGKVSQPPAKKPASKSAVAKKAAAAKSGGAGSRGRARKTS
jgi:bifunctional non-homologous end joining protein LigD